MESLSTALIGGSFDPFHNGHLHIARQILGYPGFGHVIFLPNERHNFKKIGSASAFRSDIG
jgi:cytidyltransferase-like protein